MEKERDFDLQEYDEAGTVIAAYKQQKDISKITVGLAIHRSGFLPVPHSFPELAVCFVA